jgi:NADH:ubiquinone oxidoreductase subunit H
MENNLKDILFLKLFFALIIIITLLAVNILACQFTKDRGFSSKKSSGNLCGDTVFMLNKLFKHSSNRIYHPKQMLYLVSVFLFPVAAFLSIRFFEKVSVSGRLIEINLFQMDSGLLGTLNFLYIGFIIYIFKKISSKRQLTVQAALKNIVSISYSYLIFIVVFLNIIITYKTVSYDQLTAIQSGSVLAFLPYWGIFIQPISAIIYLITVYILMKSLFGNPAELQDNHTESAHVEDSIDYFIRSTHRLVSEVVLIVLFCFLFLGGVSFPLVLDNYFEHYSVTFVVLQFFSIIIKVIFVSIILTSFKKYMPKLKETMNIKIYYNYCFIVGVLVLVTTTVLVTIKG